MNHRITPLKGGMGSESWVFGWKCTQWQGKERTSLFGGRLCCDWDENPSLTEMRWGQAESDWPKGDMRRSTRQECVFQDWCGRKGDSSISTGALEQIKPLSGWNRCRKTAYIQSKRTEKPRKTGQQRVTTIRTFSPSTLGRPHCRKGILRSGSTLTCCATPLQQPYTPWASVSWP